MATGSTLRAADSRPFSPRARRVLFAATIVIPFTIIPVYLFIVDLCLCLSGGPFSTPSRYEEDKAAGRRQYAHFLLALLGFILLLTPIVFVWGCWYSHKP